MVFLVVVLVGLVLVHGAVQQSLCGDEWHVVSSNKSVNIPASVPGLIHTDLIAAGIIGDPYYRYNEMEYRWIALDSWTYSREFYVTNDLKSQSVVELVFEGLDTVAEIFVNGKKVGTSDNMFRKWTFDVKEILNFGKDTKNTLVVSFKSPVVYAQEQHDEYPYHCPEVDPGAKLKYRNYIRKVQSDYGWDWGPGFASTGIWKEVFLHGFSEPIIEDVVVQESFLENGDIIVNISTTLRSPQISNSKVSVSVDLAGASQSVKIDSFSGENVVNTLLTISKPKLWWPIGYGEPNLYELQVSVSANPQRSSVWKKKIGFRKMELIEEPYPDEEGRSFYFKINGIPIYLKGSNIVPLDSFHTRATDEYMRELLMDAVDSNQNIIRVWGGGLYQSDLFYEIADEIGLMVWQEFIFACAMYPRDQAFLDNVRAEVKYNVRRISYHPSLVIFGGNNENEAAFGWFPETRDNPFLYVVDYAKLYFDTIHHELIQHVTDRPWVHSSPAKGVISHDPLVYRWGNVGDTKFGDVHYYNYNPDCTDTKFFPRAKLISEFGFQSFPSFNTLDSVISEEDYGAFTDMSNYRQRHPDGQNQLVAQMKLHFQVADKTVAAHHQGFKDFIYLTQTVQTMCYTSAISYWRRIKNEAPGHTMGVLYWQLNDVWQGPSWSSVEFGGRWKLLHYHVKNIFAPVLISGQEHPAANFSVYATSDMTSPLKGKAVIQLWSWNGDKIKEVEADVNLAPLESSSVFVSGVDAFLDGHKRNDGFAQLILMDDDANVLSTNQYFFSSFAEVSLNDPQVSFTFPSDVSGEVNQITFQVSSKAMAPFVFLESPLPGRFSENGYLAFKDENREITFTGTAAFDVDQFKSSLEATHVFKTVGVTSQPVASKCTDIPPSKDFTCEQQKAWGKCGEAFMSGYCEKTCGKCKDSSIA